MSDSLRLVATCPLGIEGVLQSELTELGITGAEISNGAVTFPGEWTDVWRCNWRLRTANRLLVELNRWPAADGDALAAGAAALLQSRSGGSSGLDIQSWFRPERSLAVWVTSSNSRIRDTRWIALRIKDGLVDAQRSIFGRRSSVERSDPDLPLRVWFHQDEASLLLDTSGEPLDHRGYRVQTTAAPVRENLAAACVLKSGWDGAGPVVDPMCGSGTLLAEAASWALGRAPGSLKKGWSFQRFPNYDARRFATIRLEPIPAPNPEVRIFGADRSRQAVAAARANLEAARLIDRADLTVIDAFDYSPPRGTRTAPHQSAPRRTESPEQWKKLGDLLKQKYRGWRAVVLAGGSDRGKHIGLRPRFRLPVKNGPLDARILGFDLYYAVAPQI